MPAMTALALLRFLAPDLAAVSDEDCETAIGLAVQEMDVSAWAAAEDRDEVDEGAYLNRGAALLAAHKLVLRDRGSTAVTGPVQSEKVGGLSVTYASVVGSSGPLDGSSYGSEYQQFRRIVFPGAWAV